MQNRVLEPLGITFQVTIVVITGFTDYNPVFAQLTPDNTLGLESSIITPQQLRDLIQGGAIRGNALFHSFEDFNVGDGRGVFFDLQNNTDILNIFTRVTGSNVSNILGTLGVLQNALNSNALGDANLFLLNPNGVTFGQNANLQLNGSFLATTADGFGFDDFTFSASGEEAPPRLLTISIPRFLSFRDNPGNISVSRSNLTVNQGQSLSLVGGNVNIAGSGINNEQRILTAPDGIIEIGSVGGNGLVSLTETDAGFVLGYEAIETFEDITFNQFAFLDTSGEGGGTIQLQGRDISLRDRTRIFADTQGSGNGEGVLINSEQLILENASFITTDVLDSGQGGNITINASDSVQIIGTSPDSRVASGLASRALGSSVGNSGDINITTPQLLIQGGAQVGTGAFGAGNGGNITINATNSVRVIGRSVRLFPSTLTAQVSRGNVTGNAGNLTINTSNLLIQDGAQVTTLTTGVGNGGNLIVNATDSVQLIGTSADGRFPSLLTTQARQNSTGNAGNLTINTSQLLTQDGAQVSSNTSGAGDGGNLIVNATDSVQLIGVLANRQVSGGLSASARQNSTGNAGDLTVTTSQLLIQDGARISASTDGAGDGGNIKINVDDTILIEGVGSNGRASGIFSSAESDSTGNPGSITIDPQQITIRDGGTISVNSLGIGIGGNLTIISDNLTLDNGSITAVTSNTDGGNVILNIAELLLLSNGSLISAEAGGVGNGGNLTLDTNFLVAFPANNDISANANQGNGGNIDITATGIYGIAFREASTNLSDITASSQFGISGRVNLNTPETQINQEQVEQPEELVDSSDIVAQSVCYDFGGESQLANTGRGGVPQIPGLIPRNSVVNVDLVDEVLPAPPPEAIKPHHRTDVTFIDSEGEEFKPAMGAVLLPNGMVEFVDYNPAEVYRDMYAATGCNRLSNE